MGMSGNVFFYGLDLMELAVLDRDMRMLSFQHLPYPPPAVNDKSLRSISQKEKGIDGFFIYRDGFTAYFLPVQIIPVRPAEEESRFSPEIGGIDRDDDIEDLSGLGCPVPCYAMVMVKFALQ